MGGLRAEVGLSWPAEKISFPDEAVFQVREIILGVRAGGMPGWTQIGLERLVG